mmetsp:Transcript_35033/g.76484  ORF Transcript_35033/g.76484 Transcript_35033/m.76484 type:complete len:245 (-) Transcript_35033:44-778(-)
MAQVPRLHGPVVGIDVEEDIVEILQGGQPRPGRESRSGECVGRGGEPRPAGADHAVEGQQPRAAPPPAAARGRGGLRRRRQPQKGQKLHGLLDEPRHQYPLEGRLRNTEERWSLLRPVWPQRMQWMAVGIYARPDVQRTPIEKGCTAHSHGATCPEHRDHHSRLKFPAVLPPHGEHEGQRGSEGQRIHGQHVQEPVRRCKPDGHKGSSQEGERPAANPAGPTSDAPPLGSLEALWAELVVVGSP